MKSKHVFVSIVDVGEIIPFSIKEKKDFKEKLQEEKRARKELEKFIDNLEKTFNENIYYMGMDVIGEKSLERFIFQKGGFLEILIEPPAVLNAHFVNKKRANKFCKSLKKTIKETLEDNSVSKMLIDSISVREEKDESMTVKKWNLMKDIRKD
mgnify:CR=1 FL=1